MATHFICAFAPNFSIFTQNWKMTCIINHFLQFLCPNAVVATALLLLFYTVYSHFYVLQIEANRNNNSTIKILTDSVIGVLFLCFDNLFHSHRKEEYVLASVFVRFSRSFSHFLDVRMCVTA